MLSGSHSLFFGLADQGFGFLGRYRVVVAPVTGALISGPLVYRLAIEAKGHGVPEVMEAVALRGGRIRLRVDDRQGAGLCGHDRVGCSAGREGPIVRIGATLGQTTAQAFRMSDRGRAP
ncbi:MAG: chloride channel protein [Actinomycetota bacterium]